MSGPRYIARPVVRYDVDHHGLINHLMEQLFIFIPRDDRAAIEQGLDSAAIRQGLTHAMVAFVRLTFYVDVEEYIFPEEASPELRSSDVSTTPPSSQGSGSSDDTVDPAALGQRIDLDLLD